MRPKRRSRPVLSGLGGANRRRVRSLCPYPTRAANSWRHRTPMPDRDARSTQRAGDAAIRGGIEASAAGAWLWATRDLARCGVRAAASHPPRRLCGRPPPPQLACPSACSRARLRSERRPEPRLGRLSLGPGSKSARLDPCHGAHATACQGLPSSPLRGADGPRSGRLRWSACHDGGANAPRSSGGAVDYPPRAMCRALRRAGPLRSALRGVAPCPKPRTPRHHAPAPHHPALSGGGRLHPLEAGAPVPRADSQGGASHAVDEPLRRGT